MKHQMPARGDAMTTIPTSENCTCPPGDANAARENRDCSGRSGAGKNAACQCSLPRVTFSTFILSLASSALVQLGEVPNPETGESEEDLMMANHSIEILAMLEEKTKACLDHEEARLLEEILCELRLKYVMKKK